MLYMQICSAQILSMVPSSGESAAAGGASDVAADYGNEKTCSDVDLAIALLQCVPPLVELSEQVRHDCNA
jgi:hypothetical protein